MLTDDTESLRHANDRFRWPETAFWCSLPELHGNTRSSPETHPILRAMGGADCELDGGDRLRSDRGLHRRWAPSWCELVLGRIHSGDRPGDPPLVAHPEHRGGCRVDFIGGQPHGGLAGRPFSGGLADESPDLVQPPSGQSWAHALPAPPLAQSLRLWGGSSGRNHPFVRSLRGSLPGNRRPSHFNTRPGAPVGGHWRGSLGCQRVAFGEKARARAAQPLSRGPVAESYPDSTHRWSGHRTPCRGRLGWNADACCVLGNIPVSSHCTTPRSMTLGARCFCAHQKNS